MNMGLQTQLRVSSSPSYTPTQIGLLQGKKGSRESSRLTAERTDNRKKKLGLQYRSTSKTELSEMSPIIHEVRSSPSQSLDQETRAFMEPGFGHNFSLVRIHSGMNSNKSEKLKPQVGALPLITYFPHKNTIESAFRMTLPGQAVVDTAECTKRGLPAFTDLDTVHFASPNPPLKVAAHEAVHLLQHEGLTRDLHLGSEGQAHMIARFVENGMSAQAFLGPVGDPVVSSTHSYTEIDTANQSEDKWNAGELLRVSEDGKMAVAEESSSNPNHRLWAMPPLVSNSNSILSANKSVIRLKTAADNLKGPAPDGSGNQNLTRVIPENTANGTSGDSMRIWADCGKSCRDVIGAGEGTGWNTSGMTAKFQAVHRPWYSSIPILGPLFSAIFGGPEIKEKTTAASDPEEMKKEIFNSKLGGTGDEGLQKYEALSTAEKDRFDREAKINRYATPGVGEGFTMSSGGSPMGPMTWNFHWAGVIMASGSDRVTLENYSVSNPAVQNAEWGFEMYGSAAKANQTFYEQHRASGQHGVAPTAMSVSKR